MLLAFALTTITATANAQLNVGSTTAPNAGAMLEISGSTKGLLMPRVSLTNTTTWGLTGTQTPGMAVYNTNTGITSTNVTYPKHPDGKGAYYWDGSGWIVTGAGNFSDTASTLADVVYVDNTNPNTATNFYTEVNDTGGAINDNALKAQLTTLYISTDGNTWLYNGSTYVTTVLPKPKDHDWYLAKTKTTPTNIRQAAYALGARGIGTNAPAYPLDVQMSKAAGSTPVAGNMVASFQNSGGNVGLRLGNANGRFYLGRTANNSTYGSLPGNTIFMGQHNTGGGGSANIAFGNGFGTTAPSVDLFIQTSTGNVGIGTTTPNAPLEFASTVANRKIVLYGANDDHQFYGFGINPGIVRYQVGNTLSSHAFYAAVNGTTSNELMRITGAGNVGIGTATPHAPLQFPSVTASRKVVLWEGADDDHQFYGFGVDPNVLRYQVSGAGGNHVFYSGNGATGDNELMRITAAGNVGIGTNAPATKLHVSDNAIASSTASLLISNTNNGPAAIQMSSNGFNTILGMNGSTANGALLANAAYWGAPAGGHDFQIITQSLSNVPATAAVTVKNGTNYIGLNNTNPTAPLQFSDDGLARKIVLYDNGSNSDFRFTGLGVGTNGLSMRYQTYNTNGDHIFYCGNTATTTKELLHIDGQTGNLLPGADNQGSLGQNGTRWSAVWAVNNVIQTSDRRLKTHIAPSVYGLKDIMKLRPVTYNWKATPDKDRMVGLIAQEVETIIPEAVVAPQKEGEYYGMRYTELIPVLIKGMQEQQAQIATLQQRVTEKDQRISELESSAAAYAQLAEQVKEMQQMLGLKKKTQGTKIARN